MGKLPSVFFPKRMGRSIDGCEAIATKEDTKEAYNNGIDNNVKPELLRYAKNKNRTVAFNPIKLDIPKPIFFFTQKTRILKQKQEL